MTRNPVLVSDVIAGIALALIMVVPYLYFFYAATEIAGGRYLVGGDLRGVYAANTPDALDAGRPLFMFGIPAISVYVVWMLLHRLGRFWAVMSIVLAIPVAICVGYVAFVEAFLSPEEWVMANVSLGAIAVCALIVTVELVRDRRAKSAPL